MGILLFTLPEYVSLALAKLWTNQAKLPSTQTMQTLYKNTVEERGGYGKWVLYWGPERSDGKWILLSLVLRPTYSIL